MSDTSYVAVARVELHVPEARSLKEKRAPVRSLVDRIRSRHQVLVIEAGHQELHQRARLDICALSTSQADLEARLQRVESTINRNWSGEVLSWDVEIIEI